jgi:dienelactone hydrolase
MRPTSRVLVIAAGAIAIWLASGVGVRYVQSASLLARFSGAGGAWGERLTNAIATDVAIELVEIPTRSGRLRGRVYVPARVRTRPLLLSGGVHAAGIDEPRLVSFAWHLAAGGTPIVTPELPDLLRYRVTPALTGQIEDAALWMMRERAFGETRGGLIGISFAGGLSLVAAGRPSLHDKVAFTMSFGGHGDIARVARYLCTGTRPDGSYLKPHDYGVVVILMNVADRVVPPDQVEPLRKAIATFLRASHVDMVDKARAAIVFEEARTLGRALREPAASFMADVNHRNVRRLGERLLPHIGPFTSDPALSPERSPTTSRPVHLLHGADDVVIPATESTLVAEYLRPRTKVSVLLTPLVTHAELDRGASPVEIWQLVRFWAQLEW